MSLNQLNLYNKSNPDINTLFNECIDSKLKVNIDINKSEINNDEWIDMMLFSIPYVLKALEKPNKQIVTEEEVIKIELVKKVSVESIKHLSKNTNLISDLDEETGDVTPEKLLNAFKEENYLTYENKFIYSLVRLMSDFIAYRKKQGLINKCDKNFKKIDYEAKTKVGIEKIKMKSEISVDKSDEADKQDEVEDIERKIRNLEVKIAELRNTEMYKMIDEKKITLTKSPLKMTNVLLKNVNFQYAVKLWNFLNDNFNVKDQGLKEKRNYEDKELLLTLFNESFLLSYLDFEFVKTKDSNENSMELDNEEMVKRITRNLIERILELNPEMSERQLQELLAENYIKIKSKYSSDKRVIEEILSKQIRKFVDKLRGKSVEEVRK